jgi:hypothetical protein
MIVSSNNQMNHILHRATAISLLVLVVAALVTAIAAAGRLALISHDDDLRREAESLTRLQSHLKALETRAGNKTTATVDQLSKVFLKGTDDNLILAELQSRLRTIILEKSGELISARNLAAISDQNGTQLGLSLQLRGEVAKVQEILHTFEASSPYLWIRRAALRLDERSSQPGTLGQDAPKLIVEVDVYGAKWAAPATVKNNVAPGLRQ